MPEDIGQHDSQPKQAFWKDQIEQWQQSGLSQRAYCHNNHLQPHRFYYWRRRILAPRPEVSFLPVALTDDPVRHPLAVRILMPNGCAIELEGRDEPGRLKQLVAMVAAL
jgi:hypothetical protein